jgi:vacuolar-type H+-ATPase subunit E/Vma4
MEARQIEEDACEAASRPAIAERARILHRARLASLRTVGDVREDLVNAAIARTGERLAAMRADPSYKDVFRGLLREALDELGSGGTDMAQLVADPRDRVLLETILTSMKLNLPVTYELTCWGGLIAKSEDGRVVVINTLEARLERATTFLRHHLVTLFEEKHVETGQVELIAHP